jgi:hypothetical protein
VEEKGAIGKIRGTSGTRGFDGEKLLLKKERGYILSLHFY